ncbi:MAG: 1-deoxy-D-xylulose-5-phosphate synthase [Candidatus Omnitrophica bacterium]|nr:1-deoxy-D-xylulose-5-phosphate synthase [Candidatus Omnitrophota bacterium]
MSDKDVRDAFFDEVYTIGGQDKDFVFLTDDMDAFSLRRFKQDFPSQFVNIGVAEQNMINLAAGLSLCGKKVFVYGIASYVTLRCFEQIKVNLCSMNIPVTIIGVGAGFSFSFDGPTHHGTQDIAVMRTLPEITLYNPSDSSAASRCAWLAYEGKGPVYVRLEKGVYPSLGYGEDELADGFKIVRPLQGLNIVSSGFMTHEALRLAEGLKKRDVRAGVVDLFRLKPVRETFLAKVVEKSKVLVTVEDNSLVGGIGTIVGEILADAGVSIRLKRIGVRDKQFLHYGSRAWLHQLNGLDAESLLASVSGT